MYQLCTFIHLPSYNKLTYASNDNPILHIKIELYKGQTKNKKKKKERKQERKKERKDRVDNNNQRQRQRQRERERKS